MRTLIPTTVLLAGALLFPPTTQAVPAAEVRIHVLSGRADLVTGGDALVAVSSSQPPPDVRIEVDGRDVTDRFTPRPSGELVGLVDGLRDGDNVVRARTVGGGARLTLTNHPIGGPVIAGPQVLPWVCGTEAAGLGPPLDAQCNAPAVYSYVYRGRLTGTFLSYDPDNPPAPTLIAQTTTDQGVTVPYIVRVEKGAMDRGIYQLAVLHDTARDTSPWNHKLLVRFEGGATGHHTQDPPPDVLDDVALSRGFLVATSGLLIHGSNTNQVVSAETVLMLKERIIERYGPIRYTIGTGCSGGSLQQHMVAASYPGLLDGIQPACSYPDQWTASTQMTDCHLLVNAYDTVPELRLLTPAQRAGIAGTRVAANCEAWHLVVSPILDPTRAATCNLPASQVYHPSTNPTGVRCTVQDYQRAIWGPRPQDGFAKRPFDNVGVQYGLAALNAGQLTPDQFLALNTGIGGKDIDWVFQKGRNRADPGTLPTAYRTGQVTDARQLAAVPIIDLRPYSETEYHNTVHSYQVRAKLDRDTGGHANQVIWTFPAGLPNASRDIAEQSFLVLDSWLAAVERDTSGTPLPVKVVRARPATAIDSCWINGQQVTDPARCAATHPPYGTPRIAAGAPPADDILACRLRPPHRDDYATALTSTQWAALLAAFPEGVCDWTRPGVNQQASTPWLTFADGPGGRPLGLPPVSTPIGTSAS